MSMSNTFDGTLSVRVLKDRLVRDGTVIVGLRVDRKGVLEAHHAPLVFDPIALTVFPHYEDGEWRPLLSFQSEDTRI
jgi:hypothetical protein